MQWLIRQERDMLAAVLPALHGDCLLQAGAWGRLVDLYSNAPVQRSLLLDRADPGAGVRARAEALPVRSDSVDAVVLAHTLEYSDQPHAVLREAHRVLVAGGHLVILGFNPWGWWGLWRLFLRHRGRPWSGRPVGEARLRDWLVLLDFDVDATRRGAFAPPTATGRFGSWLQDAGARGRPLPCGCFLLVARKQVLPLTPSRDAGAALSRRDVGTVPVGAVPSHRDVGAAPSRRDTVGAAPVGAAPSRRDTVGAAPSRRDIQ